MHFRQSFSKPAGTPVVLNHNSIDTSFSKQYPSPINVETLNRGGGGGGRTLFQINGFWAIYIYIFWLHV